VAKRSRTERREAQRAADKLATQREKLARLEPGGAAEHPIDVATAAVIEPHARSLPCPRCGEQQARVDEHAAREVEGRRLRVVRTACPRCGAERTVYFRIVAPN
jgi:predicted RNA-binding Zn-ribbon protein involved in translation (DUF1610 family)